MKTLLLLGSLFAFSRATGQESREHRPFKTTLIINLFDRPNTTLTHYEENKTFRASLFVLEPPKRYSGRRGFALFTNRTWSLWIKSSPLNEIASEFIRLFYLFPILTGTIFTTKLVALPNN
ncbi:MAG: hypothetical protein BGO59_25175 [Spirosoma sp. 48-14]|nr:MAG: hypothetical protein BGO59_25175 [Spirosoma sp. 48-14]